MDFKILPDGNLKSPTKKARRLVCRKSWIGGRSALPPGNQGLVVSELPGRVVR